MSKKVKHHKDSEVSHWCSKTDANTKHNKCGGMVFWILKEGTDLDSSLKKDNFGSRKCVCYCHKGI